ncbi:ABC transporter, membrane protein [Geotalea daltonii FRC-32]|uniref:Transport permease protein n=1 Tax=Geotalea daltonii (strain DSM 22248 / JCM 15807 / FRC-32) TaxID=316067 RepID=B9M6T2_GEODF|nr:ABC transporter permease [Geotalea daltonii]ACM20142.1 ABC transporter, membrane protein [Geotalea daltonii FRC-32]
MLERLKAMLIKEFIQVLRDRRMRFIIFVVPAVQTIVFGYAVNTDVRNVATAVYDLDNTRESRELVARFVSSGYFNVKEYIARESRVRDLVDRGKAKAVLRIDSGFGRTLGAGNTAPVQLILDGTDSNTAGIVLSHAVRIAARYSEDLQAGQLARSSGRVQSPGGVHLESRAWFNSNLESRNFYVPAVITNIVFIITMLLSSMAIVREKEIGTIEQIIVTPIRKTEFILGKTIPFVIIGFIDVGLISAVGAYWFDVPIRGSFTLLFAATGLFLMSSLGIGLLISTVSRTQQQAMMSAFMVIFPAMLLSGFAFPIENMPTPVQWLTLLNPIRYYLVIIRGIFLKGTGMDILWPQLAALAVLGLVILLFSVRRFRKTLS